MELNNVRWLTIDGIKCIGFCNEGVVLPNEDLTEAVVFNNQSYYFGPILINKE